MIIIIERFDRGATPHYQPSPPTPAIRIDLDFVPWRFSAAGQRSVW
jgi:hypothetical protein